MSFKRRIEEFKNFPKPGINFKDISGLLKYDLKRVIIEIANLYSANEWEGIHSIAGIESRGFIIASALALHKEKMFLMIRKAGKLPGSIVKEKYNLEYGTDELEMKKGGYGSVLIVDDVLATGGTFNAAINLCKSAGYQHYYGFSLINLKYIPRKDIDIDMRYLISYE